MIPDGSILYASDSHGVYIPQYFAESVIRETVENVTPEDWSYLEAGPDDEWYWEAWDSVMNKARVKHPTTGEEFYLYQDGDLWLIPVDAEWDLDD